MCIWFAPLRHTINGLRDYGTAQWDGGDAACDHAQGKARNDGANGRHNSDAFHGSMTTEHGGGERLYRDTCGKCGARRIDRQLGLEATPDAYLQAMVEVFREVRRVMRHDAVAFVNLGDSYQDKQLLMMPARLALALQADGWWVRSDIIWAKPNPMPESVTDRPTSAHEHVFLLTKASRYFYDTDAVAEPTSWPELIGKTQKVDYRPDAVLPGTGRQSNSVVVRGATRSCRNVWTIATEAFSAAHFATFPTALAERCIRAGTSERGCCAACGKPWVRAKRNETVYTAGDDVRVPQVPSLALARGVQQRPAEGRRSAANVSRLRCDGASEQSFDQFGTGEGDSAPLSRDPQGRGGGQKAGGPSGSREGEDARAWCDMAQEGNSEGYSASQGKALSANGEGRAQQSDKEEPSPRETIERGRHILSGGMAFDAASTEASLPLLQQQILSSSSCDDRPHHPDQQGRQTQPREHRGSVQAMQLSEARQDNASAVAGWRAGCQCNAEVVPCTVLDCFSGAGTTALVADRLGRNAIGIDLSHSYVEMSRERLTADCPLFAELSPPPATYDAEDARMADLFADDEYQRPALPAESPRDAFRNGANYLNQRGPISNGGDAAGLFAPLAAD